MYIIWYDHNGDPLPYGHKEATQYNDQVLHVHVHACVYMYLLDVVDLSHELSILSQW